MASYHWLLFQLLLSLLQTYCVSTFNKPEVRCLRKGEMFVYVCQSLVFFFFSWCVWRRVGDNLTCAHSHQWKYVNKMLFNFILSHHSTKNISFPLHVANNDKEKYLEGTRNFNSIPRKTPHNIRTQRRYTFANLTNLWLAIYMDTNYYNAFIMSIISEM